MMGYNPLVIIGAPRSGTNMLRDVLAQFSGVATWPCDEINYIWRHGNLRYPSDEIPAARVWPSARRYIRRQFGWVARRYNADVVVEKTCANSLRVPFVDAVIPEARYLFIRRDGLDVVGSAVGRWKAALDIPYLARKARFVPLIDLPYYASRYLWGHIYRFFSDEDRVAAWGPRLDDMDHLMAEHTLEEVCAIQWQRCVEQSRRALEEVEPDRWLEIGYEDFVEKPRHEVERIMTFLGRPVDAGMLSSATAGVRSGSVGKGRSALDQETTYQLKSLIGSTLEQYGYA